MADRVGIACVVSAGRGFGRDRINTGRDCEVRYWTARLGCSVDELLTAIRIVGNSIARVRAYVIGHRHTFTSIHMRNAPES